MELDELKNDWECANNQATKQTILTSKIITEMTRGNYQSKIKKIKYPELIGGIICILGVGFIGLNFAKLDSIYLQMIGVLAIILLIILPILSFLSLTQFDQANNFDKPYVEIVKRFATQKLRFFKFQKLNALLSYLLLVTVIILFPKFFYEKDISFSKSFWIFAFSFGYIFLLIFSRWVKKYYDTSLKQAEELLKEIVSG